MLTYPGFNPIAFELGPVKVHWYGIMYLLGFGAAWITEWYSYNADVRTALKLGTGERCAGFIYIGTAKEQQDDRERPALNQIVTRWTG